MLHRQRLCLKCVSIAGLCNNTVLYIMQAAVSWHSNFSETRVVTAEVFLPLQLLKAHAVLSALRINNVTTALHSTTLMQLMCSTTAQTEAGCGLAGKNHRRPLLHNQGA